MMKKVLGLSLAGLIVLCLTIGGAWAYLVDTERSSNNQVTAGTLDLLTNNVNGVTQTLYGLILKPNNTVGPASIALKNAGSLNGATLDISFNYTESDGSPNAVNMTADQTAAIIEVMILQYDWEDLLPLISDTNGNGYKDVEDLKNSHLTGLSGLNPSASKIFAISVKMRDGISNDFQADGIDITMTFLLNQ